MESNRIYVMYGSDPSNMVKAMLEEAEITSHIHSDMLIGIKPNLVVAKPSHTGATTCPRLVQAVIEYLKEQGCQNICVLESSWIGDSTARAYKVCGYETIARHLNVPLMDLKTDSYDTVSASGLHVRVSRKALGVDFLINMPVLKAHCQTKLTCALKNLKGCISDAEKRRFHTLGLHMPIAQLNKALKTDLVIVDGIVGDLTFEEGGTPVQMNRIILGMDPVLVDSYAASLLGYDVSDIDYIGMAARLGVGSMDLDRADVIEMNRDQVAVQRITPSGMVKRLARFVEARDACSACYGSLLHALARQEERGLRPRGKIHIGQGYRGVRGSGIGVGQCTRGFDTNLGGCPPTARDMVRFLQQVQP